MSTAVPDAVKRRVDRVRNRRYLARIAPINVEYVRRYGATVRHGPFAGMRYLDGLEATAGDLVAKLTGLYEHQLQAAVAEWIDAGVGRIVDVGSAEGYYAVGFAHAMPDTVVLAYDIDADARRKCAELAAINGLARRVEIRPECTPETLARLPQSGVALLCDCEGYEKTLLDPDRAPTLRDWPILVELHDFVDPTITETIVGRFRDTHDIELIDAAPAHTDLPELEFMTAGERQSVLSERPLPMRWAHLRPKR